MPLVIRRAVPVVMGWIAPVRVVTPVRGIARVRGMAPVRIILLGLLVAWVLITETAHLALVGLNHGLNNLSVVCNQLINVNLTTLVGVNLVKLCSHFSLKFRWAPFLGDLFVGFLERELFVSIVINMAQVKSIEELILLLLSKLTLGKSGEMLLGKESGLILHLSLRGVSLCEGFHMVLLEDLERNRIGGDNKKCSKCKEDWSHILSIYRSNYNYKSVHWSR